MFTWFWSNWYLFYCFLNLLVNTAKQILFCVNHSCWQNIIWFVLGISHVQSLGCVSSFILSLPIVLFYFVSYSISAKKLKMSGTVDTFLSHLILASWALSFPFELIFSVEEFFTYKCISLSSHLSLYRYTILCIFFN